MSMLCYPRFMLPVTQYTIGRTPVSVSGEDIAQGCSYVAACSAEWDGRLLNSNRASLFIRHGESKLSFPIEYFKGGSLFIYPKGKRGWGRYKDACYAYDVKRSVWCVRIKYREKERFLREIEVLSHFEKVDGVVQNLFTSSYPQKNRDAEKFHCIRKLYDQFELTWKQKFSEDSLQVIVLALLKGVRNIHAKGFVHRDLSSCNFLIEAVDGKVVDAIICDFDEAEYDSSESKRQQDLSKLLEALKLMYQKQGFSSPTILSNDLKQASADTLIGLFMEQFCK